MSVPVRIQRKRAKGWRMPPNTVSVTRPGKHGNPWRVGLIACGCRAAGECSHNGFRCETAAEAVAAFEQWRREIAQAAPDRAAEYLEPLRGKNLACFCKLCPAHAAGKPLGVVCEACEPCHVDPLLELANP